MNTGNIVEKFELLSGIESSESIKWRSVVDDACAYVYSRIADNRFPQAMNAGLSFYVPFMRTNFMLCAVKAKFLHLRREMLP